MSGPVGIMNLYYNILNDKYAFYLVLYISVVINIGLGVFNLLPLPVLDGGHIVMATLEWIRGKALSVRILEYVQLACVAILLSFVLFVSLKDVGGIFGDGDRGKVIFNPPNTPSAVSAPAISPSSTDPVPGR